MKNHWENYCCLFLSASFMFLDHYFIPVWMYWIPFKFFLSLPFRKMKIKFDRNCCGLNLMQIKCVLLSRATSFDYVAGWKVSQRNIHTATWCQNNHLRYMGLEVALFKTYVQSKRKKTNPSVRQRKIDNYWNLNGFRTIEIFLKYSEVTKPDLFPNIALLLKEKWKWGLWIVRGRGWSAVRHFSPEYSQLDLPTEFLFIM